MGQRPEGAVQADEKDAARNREVVAFGCEGRMRGT